MNGMLVDVERLDDLPAAGVKVRYEDRDRGYRPSPEEDPCNVFIRKCRVKGASTGKLAGKTVGLKDNIRVAGVPMTNGSRLLAEYVPSVDATVTERLLDAGATIVGKLNMDSFGMGGTNETSDFGPVRNPHNMEYSAGGVFGRQRGGAGDRRGRSCPGRRRGRQRAHPGLLVRSRQHQAHPWSGPGLRPFLS